MSDLVGDRAVVLGGSMAGLLVARVLAESYAEVLVVDRDDLAGTNGVPRRGVPQGHHAHGLLAAGQQALEELFPGFTDEVRAAGITVGDVGGQMRWYFNGRQLKQAHTGLFVIGAARPVLEDNVRRRVSALPNVRILGSTDIITLESTPDGSRVVGARIQSRAAGSVPEVLAADLVVDTTGKASRTAPWLESAGYPGVAEEKVKIGLAYTSRKYRLRSDPFGNDVSINPVATPSHPRGAFLHTLGGDRCLLSLTGVLGDHAPTDEAGFLAFAKSLPVPDIYEAIQDAEPLTDIVAFQYPASQRRRYERLTRFPERLLVLGDAVCSFNPVYGQGMTVAALESLVLREHLRRGEPPVPQAFFRDISKIIDAPWDIAAGGDLAFPGVEGKRTMQIKMGNAFMAKLQSAATRDGSVTAAFMRVAGLIDPPQTLMRPAFALRVLRGARQSDHRGDDTQQARAA
jgi:2-polyprenyl-6-methoxyphenol hydroxylase-like FAD-dependent oxidoreductase